MAGMDGTRITRITRFHGEYRFLSNFYPVKVEYDGVQYPTVEHAYQAAKVEAHEVYRRGSYVIGKWREVIRIADTPGRAKGFGRRVPLRAGWDEMKLKVMEELLRHKFSKRLYPVLAYSLMATGEAELIEGNDWGDRFWGATLQAFGEHSKPPQWVGGNHLGKLLMKLRSELQ